MNLNEIFPLLWLIPVVSQILIPLTCFTGWTVKKLVTHSSEQQTHQVAEPALSTAAP